MLRLNLILVFGFAVLLAGCNRQPGQQLAVTLPRVEAAKPLLVDAIDAVEFNGRLEASQTV